MASQVKQASRELARANTAVKNKALKCHCRRNQMTTGMPLMQKIRKTIEAGKEKGLSAAFIDRLTLNDKRIDGLIRCFMM